MSEGPTDRVGAWEFRNREKRQAGEGRPLTAQGLIGNFDLYPVNSVKPLRGSKHEGDKIRFSLKISLGLQSGQQLSGQKRFREDSAKAIAISQSREEVMAAGEEMKGADA